MKPSYAYSHHRWEPLELLNFAEPWPTIDRPWSGCHVTRLRKSVNNSFSGAGRSIHRRVFSRVDDLGANFPVHIALPHRQDSSFPSVFRKTLVPNDILTSMSQDSTEEDTHKIAERQDEAMQTDVGQGYCQCQHAKVVEDSNDDLAGWDTLNTGIKADEEEMLKKWEAELNNLLIFAGLLSATVTAFTVESYKWLREDPAETSAKLLADISKQISSFATAQGFINSTLPASNTSPVDFPPTALAVNINILWVLSLALSLVASFYTIAIQQWLRSFSVPTRQHIRHAIYIRQFRYDALRDWHVPMILSLLPMLIQTAVVLFFVGLFLLLRALHATIAILFGLASGIPLAVYSISVVAPLIWSNCPYRSPVLPTIMELVRPFIFLSLAAFQHLVDKSDSWLILPATRTLRKIFHLAQGSDTSPQRIMTRLYGWAKVRRSWVWNWHSWQFWDNRDLDSIPAYHPYYAYALARAQRVLARQEISPILSQCLPELEARWKTYVTLQVIAERLGHFTHTDLEHYDVDNHVNPLLLDRIDATFADELGDFLLSVIEVSTPSGRADSDWVSDNLPPLTSILTVLDTAVTRGKKPTLRDGLAHRLIRLCCGIEPRNTVREEKQVHYLPVWIYRYCVTEAAEINPSDRHSFMTWTALLLIFQSERWSSDSFHVAMAASASALHILNPADKDTDDDAVWVILNHTTNLISSITETIRTAFESSNPSHYDDVITEAMHTINGTLPKLGGHEYYGLEELKEVLDTFRDVMNGTPAANPAPAADSDSTVDSAAAIDPASAPDSAPTP